MNDPTTLVITLSYLAPALVILGMTLAKFANARSLTPPALPQGNIQVWWYQPLDLLGASIVVTVFFGLTLLAFAMPADQRGEITADALIFNIGFQMFMVAVVAAFALQRASISNWLGLYWPKWPWVFLIAPGCVMGMWAISLLLQLAGYADLMEALGVEQLQDTVLLLQESQDPVIIVLMVITAVFVAPVCEEIVFRGYLYPVMKKFTGLWPALICSSLIFSAAHGHLAVLLPLFILGALLVWVYEKTGSLWAPIAIHFCFNGAAVGIQLLARLLDISIEP